MVNEVRIKSGFLRFLFFGLADELTNFLCCHFVGAFGNQVHAMGVENCDGGSSTARSHRRWRKNVITTKIDFSIDLPTNCLLIGVAEETATRRLEFRGWLPCVEMERESELVVMTN